MLVCVEAHLRNWEQKSDPSVNTGGARLKKGSFESMLLAIEYSYLNAFVALILILMKFQN